MKKKYISPFKPLKSIKVKTSGFKIYTFNAGYKRFSDDLVIICFDKAVAISSVYTQSSTPSAAVIWDKKISKKNLCKVLIVNSGNANAYTGKEGIEAIKKYCAFASKILKCKLNQIYVSSTGVIGESLDPLLIINKLKILKRSKTKNLLDAAKAIMTTDTYPKICSETFKINGKKINIYGIAKGSGMIAPNMGTMLSYIFIEASLNNQTLNKLLKFNIENSFNSISVDGDMSTNDTVMLFSVGDIKLTKKENNEIVFNLLPTALKKIMLNLSHQIVCDGEGISRLIEVNITNAKNKIQAKKIAFSIAESLLVKTAIFGKDANWGRIIMAIGKTSEKIYPNKISLKFGKFIVAEKGKISKRINETSLKKYMKNKIIKINLNLNIGKFSKTVWSSDLTNEYIKLNTDYRS